MFNGADYLILSVVALSALIGLWRGFVKELFSLLNWVLAVALTYFFYHPLGLQLPIGEAATPWIRDVIAAILIFVCTLVAGGLLSSAATSLVKATGLSGTDRLLGFVFGLARAGSIVLMLLLFLPNVTPIEEQQWWLNSRLIPVFLEFENWALELNENVMAWFNNLLGRTG